jgi:hypothetical protein
VRWEEGTGQKVTHLVEENGRYAQAVAKLLKEHPAILYHDRSSEDDVVRKKKAASKTKYVPRLWFECLGETGGAVSLWRLSEADAG